MGAAQPLLSWTAPGMCRWQGGWALFRALNACLSVELPNASDADINSGPTKGVDAGAMQLAAQGQQPGLAASAQIVASVQPATDPALAREPYVADLYEVR